MSRFDELQDYNAQDAANTGALLAVLKPQLDPHRLATYNLSLALQAPALYMMQKGVAVDPLAIEEIVAEQELRESRMEQALAIVCGGLGLPAVNPRSHKQVKWLLYERLGVTPVLQKNTKGERTPSVNEKSMEKIKERHPDLYPITSAILAARSARKSLGVVRAPLDDDGRMHCTFKLTSNTGRWKSSKTPRQTGQNLQNITEDLRRFLVADPGMYLLELDFEQADSWNVGIETFLYTGDTSYLEALQSSDLHTQVARMVWPDLPWTGDLKADRAIAEQKFYRHYSYRFMCKKAGHGSNYLGSPPAIAMQMHISQLLASSFQSAYFKRFPGIPVWHRKRIADLQRDHYLISLLGRKRYFLNRRWDRETHKDAIAYLGQSPTADALNLSLLNLMHHVPQAELLIQVHDSAILQVPEHLLLPLLPAILRSFVIPISARDRVFHIPVSLKLGWNYGKRYDPDTKAEVNPDGLDEISLPKGWLEWPKGTTEKLLTGMESQGVFSRHRRRIPNG